jgi:hypothetical protein
MFLKLIIIYLFISALSAIALHGRQTRERTACGVTRGSREAWAMAIVAALSWPVRLVLWTRSWTGPGDGDPSIEPRDAAPNGVAHPKVSLHDPRAMNEARATK